MGRRTLQVRFTLLSGLSLLASCHGVRSESIPALGPGEHGVIALDLPGAGVVEVACSILGAQDCAVPDVLICALNTDEPALKRHGIFRNALGSPFWSVDGEHDGYISSVPGDGKSDVFEVRPMPDFEALFPSSDGMRAGLRWTGVPFSSSELPIVRGTAVALIEHWGDLPPAGVYGTVCYVDADVVICHLDNTMFRRSQPEATPRVLALAPAVAVGRLSGGGHRIQRIDRPVGIALHTLEGFVYCRLGIAPQDVQIDVTVDWTPRLSRTWTEHAMVGDRETTRRRIRTVIAVIAKQADLNLGRVFLHLEAADHVREAELQSSPGQRLGGMISTFVADFLSNPQNADRIVLRITCIESESP